MTYVLRNKTLSDQLLRQTYFIVLLLGMALVLPGQVCAQFTIRLSGDQILGLVPQEQEEGEEESEEEDGEEDGEEDEGQDGPPDAEKAFGRADRNKDGKVSVAELPAEMKPHFKGIDRNKDGAIDQGEFRGALRYLWEQKKKRAERGDKKPGGAEEKRDQKDKKSEIKPLMRENNAPGKPDASELLAAPDERGRVKFSFYGQKWDDVIDWVGRISGRSVDWTQLPGDYLNLRTPPASQGYTPEEVRDLINKHLLARGYTMIVLEDGISVYPTKDLNNALVPRVRSNELHTRMPYDFVKVSFRLNTILAVQAAEEFKPYISKNGKLVALNTTNRIEAMDAVANLRQLAEMIGQEQSTETQDDLVTEIPILHQRASKVREKLAEFLSFEIKAPDDRSRNDRGGGSRDIREAIKRMQAQLKRGGGRSRPNRPEPEKISVIVNETRNSLIVSAPPDKMVRITKAVRLLDVPTVTFGNVVNYVERIRVYRLMSLDPQEVINILEETGGLTHQARLKVDAKANAVVVHAPPEDHFVIEKLLARLDGAGRRFEVVALRRLLADEVAGTVGEMIGKKPKPERRRREWWEDWGDRGRRNREDDSGDAFKVSADIESNRLLLWCNDTEYDSVRDLLEKLGEIYRPGSNLSRMRQVDVSAVGDVDQLLREVQKQLGNVAPDIQLELPALEKSKSKAKSPASRVPLKAVEEKDSAGDAVAPPVDPTTRHHAAPEIFTVQVKQVTQDRVRNADTERPDSVVSPEEKAPSRDQETERERLRRTVKPPRGFIPQAEEQPQGPPRVTISRGADGQLVLSSADPRALDALEEVMSRLVPRRKKNWKKFDLKYASASWVKFNLEDFFQDDDTGNRRRFWDWGGGDNRSQESQLSTRRKIRFIDDPDTNTIVVINASADQLQTIQELITIYDIPEPVDSQAARVTKLITVRYSRASLIAGTIKEAYRDLLSSNDKAFQRGRQGNSDKGGDRYAGGGETFIRSFFGGQDERPASERARISFKGQLSIGVDQTSNSLIVSTTGEGLMKIVEQIVATLDKAAQPASRVQTVELSGRVNGAYLKRMLSSVIKEQQAQTSGNRERRSEEDEREEEDRRRDREREQREQREDMIRRFFD